MFFHSQQLINPIVPDEPDPAAANALQEGLGGQFHPSYTRMVPAHHVVELRLVGCPDPDPSYTRFFTPARGVLPPNLDEIGRRLRRSHPGLSLADLVIGATALELDLPLATQNVRHFPMLRSLRPPY